MDITGTVQSITLNKQIPKQGGGSYEGWELVYKDLVTEEVKSISKPSQSLKQVAGLREALEELVVSDKFVCSMEKVGQYWQIKSLAKGELATPLPKKTAWAGKGGSTGNRDYETKEERAVRQRLIVAQSSITAAVETLKTTKGSVAREDVKDLAQDYFDWVFEKGQI